MFNEIEQHKSRNLVASVRSFCVTMMARLAMRFNASACVILLGVALYILHLPPLLAYNVACSDLRDVKGDRNMDDKPDNPADEQARRISRRNFIKGVIGSGVTVSSASYLFRGSALLGQSGSTSPGERLIALNVNGQQRRVDVVKNETLAWTLRYKLGLTGTKLGCDRAECGACTVLIDDVPLYSCSVLTHTVRDKKIVTIEGLAEPNGKLHPVQQGVIDEQGFQCAFCMSGFIMSAVGFLKGNPNPTRAEMAHGLSGNLCRCQDYDKILTAMMRGAENMRKVHHA
jgi:aerobic-type carbon monoxide dehydrogenase small subunit (CoxS/CutS family)